MKVFSPLSLLYFIGLLEVISCTEDDKKAAFEQVLYVHKRWYIEAVHGLFTSLHNKLINELPTRYGEELKKCYKNAIEIKIEAKCLSEAFDRKRHAADNHSVMWIGGFVIRKETNSKMESLGLDGNRWRTDAPETTTRKPASKKITGRNRLTYLNSKKAVLRAKLYRKRRRLRSKRQTSNVKFLAKMPHLMNKKTLSVSYKIMSTLFGDLLKNRNTRFSWKEKYRKLQKYMGLARRANRNRKQYEKLLTHRDFAEYKSPKSDFEILFQNLLNLVSSSPKGKMSPRLFSPKFLSLTENERELNLFSPNLFSFYNNSKTILSLPQLLNGLNPYEQDLWLEMIMKLSGADKEIDKILQFFKSPTYNSNKERILKSDLRILDHWEKVWDKPKQRQVRKLKDDGYAFLDSNQMNILYGSNGLYNISDEQLDIDLGKYGEMSEEEKEEALENVVHSMANEGLRAGMKTWNRRLNQVTLAPFAFTPSILFPSVLGPVTLSPSIFSPAILSPFALSPFTLSPGVGDPAILSPYVLSPSTLSPFVLTPFILTPYALSPNILSPTVLGPLILSPYVLSPDILNPAVLGGLILSPYALSPIILAPGVLNADVLSPSILSPAVLS